MPEGRLAATHAAPEAAPNKRAAVARTLPGRRMTTRRSLRPGPGSRRLDVSLGLAVLVAIGGVFAALRLVANQRWTEGSILGLGALLPLGVVALQSRRRARAERVSARGVLIDAQILSVEPRRFCMAPRGDRSAWFPVCFGALTRVRYRFQIAGGPVIRGSFCVAREDGERFVPGRRLEVFVLPRQPSIHAPLLVTRWFYQLGGNLVRI